MIKLPGVINFRGWPSLLVLTVLTIMGCRGEPDASNASTQVAAIVNGEEITVHQINRILERRRDIAPEAGEEAKRRILDRLINEELAAQKAVDNKLDRSPEVMQDIEAAKKEILARAYLKQVAEQVPDRHEWDVKQKQEIQAYYSEHPELFSQRRIFTLEEISFVASKNVSNGLQEQVSRSESMREIADWLNSRGIRFGVDHRVRTAEQLPIAQLPQIQKMRAGEIGLMELGNERFIVLRLISFKESPVDEATAAPRIAQMLTNLDSRDVVNREMNRVREQAQIEYRGEFASGQVEKHTEPGLESDADQE